MQLKICFEGQLIYYTAIVNGTPIVILKSVDIREEANYCATTNFHHAWVN
jgi:hypothetical protein